MTINTRIDADPSEFNAIADWLGQGLGAGLDDACSALRSARQDDGGWDGEAADVFRSRMDEAHGLAVDLDDAFDSAVRAIETFAEALRAALDGMEVVRTTAAAAGLTVTEDQILSPGFVRPRPSAPDPDATPGEQHAYCTAVTSYNENLAYWQAYRAALLEVARILGNLAAAIDDLTDTGADLNRVTVPAVDMFFSAWIDSLTDLAANALKGSAEDLMALVETYRARALLPGWASYPGLLYRDLDDAARAAAEAARLDSKAAQALRVGRGLGWAAAGVLTGVSIWADMEAGESGAQATVSNVAGTAAAIGAAAGIGAAIGSGFPVVGTVVGAVVGAVVGGVVGIFTSGAVDSLFENGADVLAAAGQGWADVWDTGAAAVGLVAAGTGAVAGAASGAVEWAADGLSDAWDWAFS